MHSGDNDDYTERRYSSAEKSRLRLPFFYLGRIYDVKSVEIHIENSRKTLGEKLTPV